MRLFEVDDDHALHAFVTSGRLVAMVRELSAVKDDAVDAGTPPGRFERAVAYARLGRTDEARADFERLDDPATRPDIRQAARRALK